MARILTAGAEFADLRADGINVWSGFGNYVSGSTPISPQGNRSNYSFYCSNGVGLEYDFEPEFPAGLNEVYFRFHFWPGNRTDGTWEALRLTAPNGNILFRWANTDYNGGATNGGRYYNAFYNSAGAVFASASGYGYRNTEWQLYEFHLKFGGSGAIAQLKANGQLIIDWTGSLVGPSAEDTFTRFRMYQGIISGGGARTHYYDNIAVNDTTGTLNNAWPGDGYILPFFPDGNGTTTQCTNSERTSADNFSFVNRYRSRNPVGFVTPTAPNDKDTYTIPDPHPEFHSVNAIKVTANTVRYGNAITQAKLLLQPPAPQLEIQSPNIPIPQTGGEEWIWHEFNNNPNTSAPFTIDEVKDGEVGFQFLA